MFTCCQGIVTKKLNTRAPNGYNMTDGGFTNEMAIEANREPIRCLTNGKIYDSIVSASEDTKVANYLIGSNCRGRQDTAGGMEFEYVDDKKRIKGIRNKRKRQKEWDKSRVKIRNTATREVYLGLADAQRKTGLNRNSIYLCANGQQDSLNGQKFEYVDKVRKERAKNTKQEKKKERERKRTSKRQIRLISTGEIFFGISEAVRATGAHTTAILAVCNGKNDFANGMAFEYIDKKDQKIARKNRDKRKTIRDRSNKKKAAIMSDTMRVPIKCLESGKIFSSITDAAQKLGVGRKAISRSLKTGFPGRKGLTFVTIKKEK